MGRPISTYLTSEEAEQLDAFCEKHGLTKYAAFKIALTRLLTEG